MPVLIRRRSVGRPAIDPSPVISEFSFGHVVARMLSFGVELPAGDIDERAVGKTNEPVSVRGHGPRCWALGPALMTSHPPAGGPKLRTAQ